MTSWSLGIILVLCAVAAVVLIIDLIRDRSAQDSHFIVVAVLEVAVVVQLVAGCIALAATDRDVDGVVFVSYLLTVALAPIAATFIALTERSRVGTSLLLLGVLTVAGLQARLWDIWSGAGV